MFGNMQGSFCFLLIPFLCSSCNIIPQTGFVNPSFFDFTVSSHLQFSARLFVLHQLLTRCAVQTARYGNLNRCIMVAVHVRIFHGYHSLAA